MWGRSSRKSEERKRPSSRKDLVDGEEQEEKVSGQVDNKQPSKCISLT
jgi:hypothetical protein